MDKQDIKAAENRTTTESVVEDHVNGGRTFGQRLRGYFLAGILVAAPISITIYLTYIFLNFIDSTVARVLPKESYEGVYGGTTMPGLGLLIAILFFIFVGWFATNFFGRLFIRASEFIVNRMPIIRTLYNATKQIFETVMASKSQAFREPVMLEYPRKGVWSIGFVTGRTEGEVQRITENETINVFVPTTPNPTSGYLLFVPRSELKYLEMSVEEAIKLVVSAGIITPPDPVEVAAKRKAVEAAKTAKAAKVAKPSKKEKPEKAARVKQDKK
ncbi:MAG: hypothetical protein CMH27_01715 [Micavibrio sp.]|nr:hypothetical protein [Micavibrio sp.]|tara:strand:- start:990 stop:1805 length:816 start_codon:yes stop_codon:yes gene_type:complete